MILVERHDTITMQQTSTAFSQYLHDRVPVPMAMPALEGQEANLTVTLTDPLTNIAVTETVRVILTHTTLPDIPDVF